MKIMLEPGYDDRSELEQLFGEYMDMLLRQQPEFQGYLAQQHYDTELEHLRDKYGPPDGGCTSPGWTEQLRAVWRCGGSIRNPVNSSGSMSVPLSGDRVWRGVW